MKCVSGGRLMSYALKTHTHTHAQTYAHLLYNFTHLCPYYFQFLTKSSSASRRSLLALLLALCFLSCALGAKITKKVEQPPADDDNKADKVEEAAATAAAPATAAPVEENDDDDEEEADEDDDDDDDDDDDNEDDEEEQEEEKQKETEKKKKKPKKKPADKDATGTADKNELQPAVDPTDLSVWGMVRTLWGWLRSDLSESLFGDDDEKPAAVGEQADQCQRTV